MIRIKRKIAIICISTLSAIFWFIPCITSAENAYWDITGVEWIWVYWTDKQGQRPKVGMACFVKGPEAKVVGKGKLKEVRSERQLGPSHLGLGRDFGL